MSQLDSSTLDAIADLFYDRFSLKKYGATIDLEHDPAAAKPYTLKIIEIHPDLKNTIVKNMKLWGLDSSTLKLQKHTPHYDSGVLHQEPDELRITAQFTEAEFQNFVRHNGLQGKVSQLVNADPRPIDVRVVEGNNPDNASVVMRYRSQRAVQNAFSEARFYNQTESDENRLLERMIKEGKVATKNGETTFTIPLHKGINVRVYGAAFQQLSRYGISSEMYDQIDAAVIKLNGGKDAYDPEVERIKQQHEAFLKAEARKAKRAQMKPMEVTADVLAEYIEENKDKLTAPVLEAANKVMDAFNKGDLGQIKALHQEFFGPSGMDSNIKVQLFSSDDSLLQTMKNMMQFYIRNEPKKQEEQQQEQAHLPAKKPPSKEAVQR